MTSRGRTIRNAVLALAMTLILAATSIAQVDSEKAVFTFGGAKSGAVGATQLVADPAGNLYGTTFAGGNKSTGCEVYTGVPGCGVVFKLTPRAHGGWEETVLYTFTGGSDGAVPAGGVALDSAGNLYGTTRNGGNVKPLVCKPYPGSPAGCGVVFKLTPTASGPWTETVLHTFTGGKDGNMPYAGVILDASGNVYGAAGQGGNLTCSGGYGCGVVFKLTPSAAGPWYESVLYAFNENTGILPYGGLTFDSRGNLYGVAYLGGGDASATCYGEHGCGVVYQLVPTSGGPWTETILHSFTGGTDGAVPLLGVALDSLGNVYGTTIYGGDTTSSNCLGSPAGCGVVFKLTQGTWQETVLYTFTGNSDGAFSGSPVILDSAGNLYSEASGGGDLSAPCTGGCGVVFKLTSGAGAPWTETVLYAFSGGADGGEPESNLLLDSAGNIFGTTEAGGNTSECTGNVEGEPGCGVVFELQQPH
jgi:hypothetical protein